MRSAISAIGFILLFVVVFWIIGVVNDPNASGAAAVGDGIHATIKFFVTIVQSI